MRQVLSMPRVAPLLLLAALPALADEKPSTKDLNLVAGPEQTQALTDEIARVDADFFAAIFDRCDIDAAAQYMADDIEFYHDKWGQTAHGKAKFVESLKGMCERQKAGTDFKSTRVLAKETLAVYPMNQYGAIEMGYHRFYKVTPGQPDLETEAGRFTHLWKNDNGAWKVTRILSYDHKLTQQPAQ